MSNDKYTGPWAPGMRDIDGGYPFGASLVVSVGAHGLPDRWVLLSEAETIRYTLNREESEFAWSGCSPDWTNPATIGALAGVVRDLYGDPFAYAIPSGSCTEWFVYTHGAHAGMFCGPTEAAAWLAAYHAHPSVSPPARCVLDRATGPGTDGETDAAGVSAEDVEDMRK